MSSVWEQNKAMVSCGMGHSWMWVDVDYEVLGSDNGMLMVTVSGTAVVVA